MLLVKAGGLQSGGVHRESALPVAAEVSSEPEWQRRHLSWKVAQPFYAEGERASWFPERYRSNGVRSEISVAW